MAESWFAEWIPPDPDQFAFWAKFSWDAGKDDRARTQFKERDKWFIDLSADPDEIRKDQTQGYYFTGTRTFIIISAAKKKNPKVDAFCERVKGPKDDKLGYVWKVIKKPEEIDD